MICIRLSRLGRKKAPFYRIVAVDSRKKAVGKVAEVLGTWNPAKKEFKIEKEKVKDWTAKGAQVSAAVRNLLKKIK
jgi:small subunit ribosomal protein S16